MTKRTTRMATSESIDSTDRTTTSRTSTTTNLPTDSSRIACLCRRSVGLTIHLIEIVISMWCGQCQTFRNSTRCSRHKLYNWKNQLFVLSHLEDTTRTEVKVKVCARRDMFNIRRVQRTLSAGGCSSLVGGQRNLATLTASYHARLRLFTSLGAVTTCRLPTLVWMPSKCSGRLSSLVPARIVVSAVIGNSALLLGLGLRVRRRQKFPSPRLGHPCSDIMSSVVSMYRRSVARYHGGTIFRQLPPSILEARLKLGMVAGDQIYACSGQALRA